MKIFLLTFAAFLSLGGVKTAQAFPLGIPQSAQSFESLPASAGDFTAIVKLSNCSGSVIRFEKSLDSDSAMILTNGHCFEGGMPKPGQVLVNVDSHRTFKLLSQDGRHTLGKLHAMSVLYSTMTDTDITLYSLRETYAEIESKYGVQALVLSSRHPEAGRAIEVVSGFWKKIYNCSIDRFIYELKEAGWTSHDSIRYTQPGCATIGGTSGSPIIDAETREVVGVNNTGNENGRKCTMDNPCEVDEAGNVSVVYKAAYGQETFWIYSCLDAAQHLDLSVAGCLLPKP